MDNTPLRTHSLKPPRRKLQKSDPKLKTLKAKRGSADSTASLSPNSIMSAPSPRHTQNGAPDLSDAKWNHYLRPKTVVSPTFSDLEPEPPSPEPRAFFRPPRQRQSAQLQIPEFSHLSIQDPSPRPSLDSSSISSPASSTSTTSTMRRQAKTPVFRIGQLEQHALARKKKDAAAKTSSVELIADQYRAVLESRDGTETGDSRQDLWRQTLQVPRCVPSPLYSRSSRTTSRAPAIPPRRSRPSTQSVATQDTNMAAVEGDTIYFKPYSFSPPPSPDQTPESSPLSHPYNSGAPSPSGQSLHDNVRSQIIIDLLARELCSAMDGQPQFDERHTAALQVSLMIEAYERLRDQVRNMISPGVEASRMDGMFDCWLGALEAIHSSITGDASPSPSLYAGLEEDLD
ncbi:hypothetical protein ACJ41O_007023 [Fusarium nematophilum]